MRRPLNVVKPTATMPYAELEERAGKVMRRIKSLKDSGQPTWDLMIDNCESVACYLTRGLYISGQAVIGVCVFILVGIGIYAAFKSAKSKAA